ncbi:MAG TPA: hypothetical protein VEK56_18425 [Vicinamibacterales bacterium]|nr:hypothetical protein [Vicinamibacterales bacterium]
MSVQLDDADSIQGFSVHPDGKRVLRTTGLDRADLWMAVGLAQPASGWRRFISHWQAPPEPVVQK